MTAVAYFVGLLVLVIGLFAWAGPLASLAGLMAGVIPILVTALYYYEESRRYSRLWEAAIADLDKRESAFIRFAESRARLERRCLLAEHNLALAEHGLRSRSESVLFWPNVMVFRAPKRSRRPLKRRSRA